MPRRRPAPRGHIGKTLSRALDDCGLTPQQAAAAARVHKGTLYKILGGLTRDPRHSTLRRICKVLQVDIAHLIGADQLELLNHEFELSGRLSEIEQLLILELQPFTGEQLQRATELVISSLLEVKLGMGRGPQASYLEQAERSGVTSIRRAELLVVSQLREIPQLARAAAVRSAIGSLVDFRLMRGAQPSAALFQNIDTLRHRLSLGMKRPKRKRVRKSRPM